MRSHRLPVALCLCAALCQAQPATTGQPSLAAVRAKYDTPFSRNLQSFDCAVDFSWKDHFKETTRVGDEGTDEELEKLFQPIRHRVTVMRDKVTVSASLSEEAIDKLPHGGMAEGLLQHAVQKSLYGWLPASTNALLPAPGTAVSLQPSPSGYKFDFNMQGSDVEMTLAPDMRLESAKTKGPQGDRFETTFAPGPHGFLLTSWTMAEDGSAEPEHRLIFSYSYQTVDDVQLPERVSVVRESHHEVWRYRLTGCTVKTGK